MEAESAAAAKIRVDAFSETWLDHGATLARPDSMPPRKSGPNRTQTSLSIGRVASFLD